MKTAKSILIATTLICASVVSTLSAQQQAQPAPKHEFSVEKGDSVMIRRECQKYSTGERPSTWVWDKVHTVRQLGTKRHPDGVLLMNIYSWVCDTCLTVVNGHAKESAEKAAIEQAADREAFEQGDESARKAAAQAAAIAAADSAFRAAEEARRAEEEARRAEEEAQAALRAQEDSLKSLQQFKHNYDRFTIGLRGGASALMHHAENGNWTCGGDVVLDLQYAHYWQEGEKPSLGILTGLSAGYVRSGVATNGYSQVVNAGVKDAKGNDLSYTLNGDAREYDGQVLLEIPLMFSMITNNGFFFNIGPRFQAPLFSHYKQTIESENIGLLFPGYNVTITNEPGISKLTDTEATKYGTKQPASLFNILLGAELGYEWRLQNNNAVGLGVYAGYGLFSLYNNANTGNLFTSVTAPTGTNPAVITVDPATKAFTQGNGFKFGPQNGMDFFDCGIKLNYSFNFVKQ